MKKYIIILLLISRIASATNYYVKNGGNDAGTGVDDANAWATISKVNSSYFSAGDSIFFKRGNKFIGTITPSTTGELGSYITFGAYGTGQKPIITPNDTISGISWSVYGTNGIYYTTDIGYNPENILIDWEDKILKINDYWVTHTPTSRYGNLGALALMEVAESQTYYINYQNVYFWDGIDALYCYEASSGRTYLRFRGKEDPNDSTFAIAGVQSSAVNINSRQYIIVQNLHLIGGRYGVDIEYVNYSDTSNVIIENCYIESSNEKVYIHASSRGITVRNDTLTNNYLTSYNPGAWYNAGTYLGGVRRHIYEFGKYRISLSESGEADAGILHGGGISPDDKFYGNTILNCINGMTIYGDDTEVYNNYISGTSSSGIYIGQAADSVLVHDNYITNSNICFRLGSLNDPDFPKTYFIYKNRCYLLGAGSLFYIHYDPETAAPYHPPNSVITAYIYHNSFIISNGIDVSGYAAGDTGGTGLIFINNIFSCSGNNTIGYTTIWTQDDLFKYYYNWTSGRFYYAVPSSDTAVWAEDASNISHLTSPTFWDHSIVPPDFTNIDGTEAIDAGIDISQAFVLGGTNYSALPGFSVDYWSGEAPDLGYYELETGTPPVVPSVSTLSVSSLAYSGATIYGSVTYEGERSVTDRGFCYALTANPTLSNSHVHVGSGIGDFSQSISGLNSSTTYHVRAFATNNIGTSYGIDLEFTTLNSGIIFHQGKLGHHGVKKVIIK